MKGDRFTLCCMVLLALGGCSAIHGPFSVTAKPGPPLYEEYKKPGATQLDVKRALLECGEPATTSSEFVYEKALGMRDREEQVNYRLLTGHCMENSGFLVLSVTGRWHTSVEVCSRDIHKRRPACQPGAIIPQRSVERRLNSWWCKLETDRDYCRLHAFTPSACDDPAKDYNNPPPECRP